jgi:mono/diheme cytochrome c family protein
MSARTVAVTVVWLGGLAGCSTQQTFGPSANATRGEYLVQAVLFCGDCHTTPQPNGLPSFSRADFLAGGRAFPTAIGTFYSRNLTSDNETGLGKWTDAQIKRALTHGLDDQGQPLFPLMPYWTFANLTANDLEAIVRFLRTLGATSRPVPDNTFTITMPAVPLDASRIPHTTLPASDPRYASAERGRYFAGLSCIVCHSPNKDLVNPIDVDRAFSGGQVFEIGPLSTISANLTPAASGLTGWSVDEIIATLQKNQERGRGRPLCPPMPAGPNRAGDMTPEDLLDIANYLTTMRPIEHGPFGCSDGGVPYGFDAL